MVQPRKTRPCLTERLLMGRKESNETNKQTNIESGNKTKEGKLAAELVAFEIASPCFVKAVISIPLINFTAMSSLRNTKTS